jgi:hypothetical protein
MMYTCDKCMKMGGLLFLILGILFLLQDLAIWDFWNISWYTALFLLAAVMGFATASCPACQTVRKGKK